MDSLEELKAAYGGEAVFRPSRAPTWMNCPGSVRLSAPFMAEQRTVKPSPWAAEGTAAHKFAERCLRDGISVASDVVGVDLGGGYAATAEMASAVQVYLDEVNGRLAASDRAVLHVEYKLSLAPLDPDDSVLAENRGTADVVILDYAAETIRVIDLKYGMGVPVPATSAQLRDYACMAIATFAVGQTNWKRVEVVVAQPRMLDEDERVKTACWTVGELLEDFYGRMRQAMEDALGFDPPLVPDAQSGQGWCRWCQARSSCPALLDNAANLARDVFDAVPMFTAASAAVVPSAAPIIAPLGEKPEPGDLPSPAGLGPDEVATVLSRIPLWGTWIAGVKERAVQMLHAGTKVPGWNLKPRTGHRRWKDPDAAPEALRALGLKTIALYSDPKLKSPAKIEKLLPSTARKRMAELVERPEGELVLVHDTGGMETFESVFGRLPIEEV